MIRNARAKGKTLGRPQAAITEARLRELLAQNLSLAVIGEQLGCSAATVCRRPKSY
jgi:DNA invertase Pin-like site-specific DNA recombinase